MWKQVLPILAAFAAVLGLPFALREEEPPQPRGTDVVTIVTPHNESIRHEFARGFREWYRARTGREVFVDYRNVGGTTEIVKYLESQYLNAFRNHWEKDLGRAWSHEVQTGFANRRLRLDETPEDDTAAEAARRAFLASEVSCGFDLFFGGGSFDFIQQAQAGRLVDSGFLRSHAHLFDEARGGIPATCAGEPMYDPEGRWFGAVLSSFGIIYNTDALRRVGFEGTPDAWADLADPRLFRQVAVADPTLSGAITKAFEMIVQERMQRLARERPDDPEGAVRRGWAESFDLIQRISANARYYTDTSQKPNIDTASGDCAAGMSIDFFGRFQQESVLNRGGGPRFGFITPPGGSTVSVDPIGMLRGARHRETALLFMEYVLGPEGQALWNFRVGAEVTLPERTGPDGRPLVLRGPAVFALRRPPVLPLLYESRFDTARSDPTVRPYEQTGGFNYRAEWTAPLFNELRFIIKVAFIDVQPELRDAWGALIEAGFPPEATRVFSDLSAIDFDQARGRIKDALALRNKIEEVRLARELSLHFREQYRRAGQLAQAGR